MKRKDYLLLVILTIVILASILNVTIGIFNNYTLLGFLVIILGITYWTLGFIKNKSIIEKDVILSIVIYLVFYYLLSYSIGYFVGFKKNIFNTGILMILKNTLPIILLIILTEIIRYMVNTHARNKKALLILSFCSFTLINITIILHNIIGNNMNTMGIIQQIGLFILPAIANNLLLTYLSIKVGYESSIAYRLLVEIPMYIVPIIPAFGDYVDSIIRITIPILFLLWLYRKLSQVETGKIIIIEKKGLLPLPRVILLSICFVIVYLISSFFRFQALVIATGSMTPQINIGDVVIVDKYNNTSRKYKKGEVIAYKKDNIIVCHRIINIINDGDTTLYETKGDNNDTTDQLLVNNSQVIGIVKTKIKYIGYPTVILNSFR